MDFSKYTDRQRDILNGNVPWYLVEDNEVRRLLVRSIYRYDREKILFVEKEMDRRHMRCNTCLSKKSRQV